MAIGPGLFLIDEKDIRPLPEDEMRWRKMVRAGVGVWKGQRPLIFSKVFVIGVESRLACEAKVLGRLGSSKGRKGPAWMYELHEVEMDGYRSWARIWQMFPVDNQWRKKIKLHPDGAEAIMRENFALTAR